MQAGRDVTHGEHVADDEDLPEHEIRRAEQRVYGCACEMLGTLRRGSPQEHGNDESKPVRFDEADRGVWRLSQQAGGGTACEEGAGQIHRKQAAERGKSEKKRVGTQDASSSCVVHLCSPGVVDRGPISGGCGDSRQAAIAPGCNCDEGRVLRRLEHPHPARNDVLVGRTVLGLRKARGVFGEGSVSSLLRCATAVALLIVSGVAAAQSKSIRVAVVTDGPGDREVFSAGMIEREVANVVSPDVRIVLPADKRFAGDWSLGGVSTALERALRDPDVDLVLALGILASHQAAHRDALPKPVIAPLVIDPVLQGFPLIEGRSGRRNFTYAADFQSVGNEVQTFHRLVGFEHVVALVDEALLAALPELAMKAREFEAVLKTRISLVRTGDDVKAALAALPPDVDAVYVTGLLQFQEADIRELARGLIARRLPSFSVLGRSELESGLLMTTGGAQRDDERLARRVVLMIQRIGDGEDPATFDVSFPTAQRLAINMRTARAIGFSPRWQDLADAEQLYAESPGEQPPLTLIEAMRVALDANPALAASRARLGSSADDVRIARSNLLPSLDASAAHTRIDADRASPLTQAEETTTTGLALEQIVYSERAWAGYSISRSLHAAAQESQRQDMLDILEAAASAYLEVLRSKSVEGVRRSNVENTRRNLETSRVREAVGLSERSDLLRWVAQLARDKQNLVGAEAARRQAETELARILHRPASQPFATVESGLDDPLGLVSNPRTQAFLDTPAKWAIFMEYAVRTALDHAPEIGQAEALIAGRRRAVTAARRAYFLPDLAVVSNGSRLQEQRGAGSIATPGAPDDESWSVSLRATLPIFTGGLRGAEQSQARHELRAAEAERAAVGDAVEARTRAALHRTGGSYPSIALSREAASAADENLTAVQDAYARGAVSVTELIDAQDTALAAGLAAADARYGFLTDFMAVLRAMSEFEILLDPGSREAWYRRIDEWFRSHEGKP
jgi:outer membrane protein